MEVKEMKQELEALKKQEEEYQSKIAEYPKGTLFCNHNQKTYKWFVQADGEYRYLSKKKIDQATKLAMKGYYQNKLLEVQNEIQAINRYLKSKKNMQIPSNRNVSENQEFQRLIHLSTKQSMANHIKKIPLEEKITNWMQEEYKQNPDHPENLIHKSMSGHLLRSKAEAMIDDALTLANIPFRYECELMLMQEGYGQVYYPDFTILHPRTGRILYWEHFGLIENEEYRNKMMKKIEKYMKQGIYPGINLIMTFETKDEPLGSARIKQILGMYFGDM